MLVLAQQIQCEDNNIWQDVSTPSDVYTIKDWQERLRRWGLPGKYRAVEDTITETSVTEFYIKKVTEYEISDKDEAEES